MSPSKLVPTQSPADLGTTTMAPSASVQTTFTKAAYVGDVSALALLPWPSLTSLRYKSRRTQPGAAASHEESCAQRGGEEKEEAGQAAAHEERADRHSEQCADAHKRAGAHKCAGADKCADVHAFDHHASALVLAVRCSPPSIFLLQTLPLPLCPLLPLHHSRSPPPPPAMGPTLRCYHLPSGRLLAAVDVFDGVRIHGIVPRGSRGVGGAVWTREGEGEGEGEGRGEAAATVVVVHGERRVKLVVLTVQQAAQVAATVTVQQQQQGVGERRETAEQGGVGQGVGGGVKQGGEGGQGGGVRMAVGACVVCRDHWAGVLAVGLSDNSVELWATAAVGSDRTCGQDGTADFSLRLLRSVSCSGTHCSPPPGPMLCYRSLLYAMRLHWHAPSSCLHVAAGTIFNQCAPLHLPYRLPSPLRTSAHPCAPLHLPYRLPSPHLTAHPICLQLLLWSVPLHASACCATLGGSTEEPCHLGGSACFSSCLPQCSARVWRVTMPARAAQALQAGSSEEQLSPGRGGTRTVECAEAHRVLFGHGARLWDAHLHSQPQVAVTVSEDCTARVWSIEDGRLLALIPAHQGRGIWRCVVHPPTRTLITGGADAAINLHALPALPSPLPAPRAPPSTVPPALSWHLPLDALLLRVTPTAALTGHSIALASAAAATGAGTEGETGVEADAGRKDRWVSLPCPCYSLHHHMPVPCPCYSLHHHMPVPCPCYSLHHHMPVPCPCYSLHHHMPVPCPCYSLHHHMPVPCPCYSLHHHMPVPCPPVSMPCPPSSTHPPTPWLLPPSHHRIEPPPGLPSSKSEFIRCMALASPRLLLLATNLGALLLLRLPASPSSPCPAPVVLLPAAPPSPSHASRGPIVCLHVEREEGSAEEEGEEGDVQEGGEEGGEVGEGQGRRGSGRAGLPTSPPSIRHVFTTDPAGSVVWWHMDDTAPPPASSTCPLSLDTVQSSGRQLPATAVASIQSPGGARVVCVDACPHSKVRALTARTPQLSLSIPLLLSHPRRPSHHPLLRPVPPLFGPPSSPPFMTSHVPPAWQLLALGDQRGHLYLYRFSLAAPAASRPVADCHVAAVLKGAHGISAVASVAIEGAAGMGAAAASLGFAALIHTTGRDGCICTFALRAPPPPPPLAPAHGPPCNSTSTAATSGAVVGHTGMACAPGSEGGDTGMQERGGQQGEVVCVGVQRAGEVGMVERVVRVRGGGGGGRAGRVAVGFAAADFVVWSVDEHAEVARIACGGWRRPHAFLIDALCMGSFAFAFLKGNHVHIHRTTAATTHAALPSPHAPPPTPPSSLHPTFHGRELHSLALLPLPHRPSPCTHTPSSHSPRCSSLLLSASEDGCLRASLYDPSGEGSGGVLEGSAWVGEHVGGSAIRAIATCAAEGSSTASPTEQCGSSSGGGLGGGAGSGVGVPSSWLVFTAGAREVLMCWLLLCPGPIPPPAAPCLALSPTSPHAGQQGGQQEVQTEGEQQRAGREEVGGRGEGWEDVFLKGVQGGGRAEASGEDGGTDGRQVLSFWLSTHRPDKRRVVPCGSSGNGSSSSMDDDVRYLSVTAFSFGSFSQRGGSSQALACTQTGLTPCCFAALPASHAPHAARPGTARPLGPSIQAGTFPPLSPRARSSVGHPCPPTTHPCSSLVAVVAAATSAAQLHLLAFHAPSLSWHRLASLHHHSCPVLSLHHLLLPPIPEPSATSPSPAAPTAAPSSSLRALPRCLITSGATDGAVVLWDVTAPVTHFLHATWHAASHPPPLFPSSLSIAPASASSVAAGGGSSGAVRPVSGRGSEGGQRRRNARWHLQGGGKGHRQGGGQKQGQGQGQGEERSGGSEVGEQKWLQEERQMGVRKAGGEEAEREGEGRSNVDSEQKAVGTVGGRGDQGGAGDGEERGEGKERGGREEGSEGKGGEEGQREAQGWAGVEVGPLCVVRGAHQSGVNCIAAAATATAGWSHWPWQETRADGGDGGNGGGGVDGVEDGGVRGVGAAHVVVVSGGDDEAVHAVVLLLDGTGAEHSAHAGRSEGLGAEESGEGGREGGRRGVVARVVARTSQPNAHSAAVKGIWTDGQVVLSVGLDQRLRCWSLSSNHHAPRGKAGGAEAAAEGRCSVEGQRGERGRAGEEGGEGVEGSRLDAGEVTCGAGEAGAGVDEVIEGGMRLEGKGRCVVDVPEAEGLAVMGQGEGRYLAAVCGRGMQLIHCTESAS
ncbi:unnamed protein product [Closterium sp. NIES-65]|nr:unnamed protein product [Closterium sp. NIES-65]